MFKTRSQRAFIASKMVLFFSSLFCVMLARPYTSLILCAFTYVFAFALFFLSICDVTRLSWRFSLAFIYFFCVQLFQVRWLANTYYQGAGIVFVYLIVVSLLALCFALLVTLTPSKRVLKLYEILGLCSLWALLEYARVFFFSGFTFNPFALFVFFSKDLLQMASFFGSYFLSFMVLFVNFFAYNFFLQRSVKRAFLLVCALFLPLVFVKALALFHKNKELRSVSGLIMQPALMSEQRWEMSGFDKPLVGNIEQIKWVVDQIQEHKEKKLDIVILPEVAFNQNAYDMSLRLSDVLALLPFSLEYCAPLKNGLAEKIKGQWFVSNSWVMHTISNYYKVDVFAGLSDYNLREGKSYNAFFLFKKGDVFAQRHVKRVLIPLTEYLPFTWLTKFMKTFGIEEFYQKGNRNSVLNSSFFKIAPAICIEEGYGDIIKKSVQRGGDVIVSVNNDVWFPYTTLSQEHLYLAALRAVENGVFVLRASNTGISAVLDPNGSVVASLNEFEGKRKYQEGALYFTKSMYKKTTLYTSCNFALDRLIFSCLLLFSVFMGLKENKDKLLALKKKRLL